MEEVKLYESQVLRGVSGPAIRPGGFELTDQGLSYCRLAPAARVLDVGCGTGAVVDFVRQRHGLAALGLDFSALLLEEGSRTNPETPLVRGRAEQLPTSDNSFAAVLCECVLSLCAHPSAVLREIRRVLEPGGYLVLTDVYAREPAAAAWTDHLPAVCCLKGAVDRSKVEDRLAATGYELLVWEDHSPLLKQLAAQLIWTYGSLDAFWSAADGPAGEDALDNGKPGGGGCHRPGYFLMVAQKPQTGKSPAP